MEKQQRVRLQRITPGLLLALILLLTGCSELTTTPVPFSRDQAIARATQDAKQSVPEVGIQQARIDTITAELITLGEADRRVGGQRGPGGYAAGQTPQSLVWWVTVRGYFQYEGMAAAPNPPPICDADERDFIYDVRTGEGVGGPIPNASCAPPAIPSETSTLRSIETPKAIPLTLHDEIEATPSPTAPAYSPWVGTPALGNPPRSDQLLPKGVSNGDIIECHLLWFIWENTKSRIWFPNTAPAEWFAQDPFFGTLKDGPDATGKLTGRPNSTSGWYVIATTPQDYKETEQVYVVDSLNKIRYPIRHKKVAASECAVIPTAAGDQYDPVLVSP